MWQILISALLDLILNSFGLEFRIIVTPRTQFIKVGIEVKMTMHNATHQPPTIAISLARSQSPYFRKIEEQGS